MYTHGNGEQGIFRREAEDDLLEREGMNESEM